MRATFFKHFPTNAAIYGFGIETFHQRIARDLIDREGSAKERLELVGSHMDRFSSALGPGAAQMFTAFISRPGGGFRIDDPHTGIEAILKEIVQEGQAKGEFSLKL